ncbi:hypothetical protein [Pseudomonas sp. IT-P171]|uniref:hypothetical protein n=1 Tax=Pseudomonas sp. IT-P171 TaxID=3026453 RepID=UPI0039E18459
MHRIDGAGATVDNKFTEGDPVGGVQATVVTDDWLNDVQEELMSVLTAGGIPPVKGTQDQVLKAVKAMVAGAPTVQGAFKKLQGSTTGLNASISVSADEIVVASSANLYATLRGVAVAINSAASGANGLDTGSLAASTWYSTWIIWNGTTVSGLISLSATAPTLPSGYTHRARTGWIRTDGTANKYPLSWIQIGRKSSYKVAAGSNVVGCPVISSGSQGNISTPTWLAVSTAAVVPPTAASIDLVMSIHAPTTSSGNAIAAPNNAHGAFNSAANPPQLALGVAAAYDSSSKANFMLESTNIYYASNNTTAALQCVGWEDNL